MSFSANLPVRCVVVLGPTATGKTKLGVDLAVKFNGEIISADSRQVYRGMNLGTGKDLDEYKLADNKIVPYHLIDVVDPNQEFNLHMHVNMARRAILEIAGAGKLPIICGGTALIVNALINNYQLEGGEPDPEFRSSVEKFSDLELLGMLKSADPDIYQRTDKTQRRRIIRALEIARSRSRQPKHDFPPHDCLLIGPFFPRGEIHKRIELRLKQRLDEGMLEEVAKLHEQGVSWERLDFFGLEYRHCAKFLQGEISRIDFENDLLAGIRNLCKAQEIWFRKMEREGKDIYWIPSGDLQESERLVSLFLNGQTLPKPQIRLSEILYGPQTNF